MALIESLMMQQQYLDRLFPNNMTAIDKIVSQQLLDKIAPKSYTDLADSFHWMDKFRSINFNIPDASKFINLDSFIFDSTILKINESYKWIEDFQKKSSPFTEFSELFKDGFKYEFIERNFAKLYEDADEINDGGDFKSSIFVNETQRIREVIREIYLNNLKLFSIHPREFEKMIAELLHKQGFIVELTKQTRDNGYDILALRYIDNFTPIKYLVECKRFNENRKVGVEIIRSFKEVISTEQANKGIIVTSSYFTKDALKKQTETPYLLDYKNKDEVIAWVNNYCSKNNNRQ